MIMKRLITVLYICLLVVVAIQAQDFRINRFKENMMDLTAAQASVKDKNGDICALIKFSAKDDQFDFEPNLGIMKTEKKVGEVWIYVPHHTKLITIRHPFLGVLRNYKIPVDIEQKVVYEADLEITNDAYIYSLLQINAPDSQKPIEQEIELTKAETPQSEPDIKQTTKSVKTDRNLFFELGAGFNVLGIMGPTAHIGVNYKQHVLEVGAILGVFKVENISIYQTDNNTLWGTYNYNAMRFFARYGYNFEVSSFLITPLIGAAINNISGNEEKKGAGNLFEKVNTVSANIGCRLNYCISKTFRVYVTPEYSLGIKKDKSFDVIKEADSKIKSWTDGFGVSAGIIVQF